MVYSLVTDKNTFDFNGKCSKMCEDGWLPHGSVAMTSAIGVGGAVLYLYAQAFTYDAVPRKD